MDFDYKGIVVALDASARGDAAAHAAAQLAAHHGATLAAVHAIDIPGFPAYVGGAMPVEVVALQREHYEAAALEVKSRFEAACKAAGVEGEWRCEEGLTRRVVARHARCADLVVMGGPRHDDIGPPGETLAEEVVLDAGRPVMVCPRGYEGGAIGSAVTVAWDGSREAARAVADALGFLRRARVVEVVTVHEDDAREANATALVEYLARHGIAAGMQEVERAGRPVAACLLEHARAADSDLVVMGAYGHARIRELLLGGATRDMLNDTDVPLLMSH